MGSRIKLVPDATPDADGEWREIQADLSGVKGWRHLCDIVEPLIPSGYHIVAVERGTPDLRPKRPRLVTPENE